MSATIQENTERNAHIPDSVIKKDISDTQREIDNYTAMSCGYWKETPLKTKSGFICSVEE